MVEGVVVVGAAVVVGWVVVGWVVVGWVVGAVLVPPLVVVVSSEVVGLVADVTGATVVGNVVELVLAVGSGSVVIVIGCSPGPLSVTSLTPESPDEPSTSASSSSSVSGSGTSLFGVGSEKGNVSGAALSVSLLAHGALQAAVTSTSARSARINRGL